MLVMLSAKQNKPQVILPIISSRVEKYIPTSWVSLASTLYTQGLFYPVAGAA
jgi:hypothetical protein